MARLVLRYGSRIIKQCRDQCRLATRPECRCICGGANHGLGHLPALTPLQTEILEAAAQQQAERVAAELNAAHPNGGFYCATLTPDTEQLTLFTLEEEERDDV